MDRGCVGLELSLLAHLRKIYLVLLNQANHEILLNHTGTDTDNPRLAVSPEIPS